MKKKILSFKQFFEDVPTNSAGAGHVDGLGVGPRGEPGGSKFILNKKIIKRKGLKK